MPIPKPMGEIIGAVLYTCLVLIISLLSIYNLLRYPFVIGSTIASLLWLALIVWYLTSAFMKAGVQQYLTNLYGYYACGHFIESIRQNNLPAKIRFGYRLFGHRFYYLSLPVDRIKRVEWSTGQASSLAGKDMNDWSVVIWYGHDASMERTTVPGIYIVGPARRKTDTAAFGQDVIRFLNDAGVMLLAEKDHCTFTRQHDDQ